VSRLVQPEDIQRKEHAVKEEYGEHFFEDSILHSQHAVGDERDVGALGFVALNAQLLDELQIFETEAR
jgi:hypothetical protein